MKSIRADKSTEQNSNFDKEVAILLVDDFDIMRLGLKLTINSLPNLKVVGECADGEAAITAAKRLNPDVVLLDIGLPRMGGIEALTLIKQGLPKIRVIMLTGNDEDENILAAFGAGADGYCLKDLPASELGLAINKVLDGNRWIDPRLTDRVVKSHCEKNTSTSGTNIRLASSDLKILRLLQEGKSCKEIGDEMGLRTSMTRILVRAVVDKLLIATDYAEEKIANGSSRLNSYVEVSNTPSPGIPAILKTEGAFAGRYKLEEVIGKGGMGVVYKARHLYMERDVAIKVLSPESASDLKSIAQFKKESQAASALKHDNIITVYDFGVTESLQPFLVMDYINGDSLDSLFHGEAIDSARLLGIFRQVCDGLAATHAHGLIHCDLKPSNIMLEKEENGRELVKIVDFGLAKAVPKSTSVQVKLTDSFEISGSPLYMSPEQCTGSAPDARSDVYALGCIMYEGFTGKPVFNGLTAQKVFSQHLSEDPTPFALVQTKRQLDYEVEPIVLKCLAKDPDARYQSALDLRDELNQVLKNKNPK